MYKRIIADEIYRNFFSGEVMVIVGARQVGKTYLLKRIIKNKKIKDDLVFLNCDYLEDRELLNQQKLEPLKRIIGKKKYLFIDEGQKAENIGNTLKMLVDFYKKEKQIIVTGSSSIHLLDQTAEPLTGRKRVFYLYPISASEIIEQKGELEFQKQFTENLIFGSYPKVLNQLSNEEKIISLKELASSNLYRDILEFQLIKNPSVLNKLLKALALQVGSEVSLHKLGNLIGINLRTAERYIDLLEKSFVIFRLAPYVTNKRKEISKMHKIYFYDLGIRNAIINNFNILENRNDVGQLFENYFILERMKYRSYYRLFANQYFWKNYEQSEVDLIEEFDGNLQAYELKWSKHRAALPLSFRKNYQADCYLVSRENFLDFLLKT